MIHVCSLARLHETVTATGASHIVTLINKTYPVIDCFIDCFVS